MHNFILPLSFLCGLGLGHATLCTPPTYISKVLLLGFLISVGRDLGELMSSKVINFHRIKRFLVLIMLNIFGALFGGALIGYILPSFNIIDGMLIASSMGFYSVGSALLTTHIGSHLGIVCFIVNFLRESSVLLFATSLNKIHPDAPIHIAGAAAIDTCLSRIQQHATSEQFLLAITSGGILTIGVPFLMNILLMMRG